MTLPEDCRPRAPQPPEHRIEAAAREICDALAADHFGGPQDRERAVDLRTACSGLRRYGHQSPIAADDFRWAVKLMLDYGLLKCREVPPGKSVEDEFFDLTKLPHLNQNLTTPSRPEYRLISTPQLWVRWQKSMPFFATDVPETTRIRCDAANRSVYLDEVCLAHGMELSLFRMFQIVAEEYPNAIKFTMIKTKVKGIHGKHSTRDFRDRLPPKLRKILDSGKNGYFLILPIPKSSTTVHAS